MWGSKISGWKKTFLNSRGFFLEIKNATEIMIVFILSQQDKDNNFVANNSFIRDIWDIFVVFCLFLCLFVSIFLDSLPLKTPGATVVSG